MKKITLFVFTYIAFLSFSLHAQVNYKINENTYQKVNISFRFGTIKTIAVSTEEGDFSRIYIDGCVGSNNTGEPELPVSVNLLEIPIFEDYVLNVYGNDFVIYDATELGINYPVYPAQPPVSKSHEGPVASIQNKNTYQTDAFYALPLAWFEETGIMRNLNLGTLYVCPVQYNPVTQQIKIYKSIDVEILFKKVELVKTQTIKELHKSPLFHPSHIINPMENSRVEFENTPITYLIVAHKMFKGALDEFITWKKRKGFLVEVGYTDDPNVGATADSIANFIKSHYTRATSERPAPTFVLLVGDVQQIPTFTVTNYGTHPTDLYYFTWAGGNIPCCYYGRFSAQNVNQLTPQIEKTLQYEQFTMPDANYLNDIVLIAGYDDIEAPTYGNGFINYVTQYYATEAYGYNTVYKHPHPCNSLEEAAQIRAEIGAGVGIANYTAHCSASGWANPPFHTMHISAMNNLNKYGLMIGSCCLSSKFNDNECFGEALLRASGKGAVGYIGASNETYWDEDYYWSVGLRTPCTENPTYDALNLGAYDRLFHTHKEEYAQWMTTFGAMIIAGNEAVQTSTTFLKKYYWEIYHLMGDPSVMAYLTKPAPMTVTLPDKIYEKDKTLNAKVAPYSYCALTDKDGDLVTAGFADAVGNVTLHFDSLKKSGNYEFAAWAQNRVQYFKSIPCVLDISNSYNTIPCSIYPNPAFTTITIETDKLIVSYEIMDMKGCVVASNPNVNQKNEQVNIALLTNGIYFVKVTDIEQNIVLRKFVKL